MEREREREITVLVQINQLSKALATAVSKVQIPRESPIVILV